MDLPSVWFVVIAVLWTGYLLLEGFDLGVGMLLLASTRDQRRRRLMLNTIGPVWDGNEVWLVTAIAATFAAFPLWYASLLSSLYLPLTVTLVGLIFRAVAIEYRGKGDSDRWRRRWDRALGIGSFVTAFGIGILLAVTTTGLPIDANGDRVGGPTAWVSPLALLGGLASVGFSLVHAATFLGLKTTGPVRERAGRFVGRWSPVALLPFAGWVVAVQSRSGDAMTWAIAGLGIAAAAAGWVSARRGHEGRAFLGFAGFLTASMASIFAAVFPVVLPSTVDSRFDLTVVNATSSDYTLGVMSVISLVGLPLVLLYQGFTYWVFRARLAEHHLPEAHPVLPATGSGR